MYAEFLTLSKRHLHLDFEKAVHDQGISNFDLKWLECAVLSRRSKGLPCFQDEQRLERLLVLRCRGERIGNECVIIFGRAWWKVGICKEIPAEDGLVQGTQIWRKPRPHIFLRSDLL